VLEEAEITKGYHKTKNKIQVPRNKKKYSKNASKKIAENSSATISEEEAKSTKFVGHEGIANLCENYFGVKYLRDPIISTDIVKNRSADDLKYLKSKDLDIKYSDLVRDIRAHKMVDMYVKFVNDTVGFGLFANTDIKAGEFIGEYTGDLVEELDDGSYAWNYPSKEFYKDELNIPNLSMDAKYAGNGIRFSNHSENHNASTHYVFVDGILRVIYVALKDIKKDEEILSNYGEEYWKNRPKVEL
jgi:hypothetical protein